MSSQATASSSDILFLFFFFYFHRCDSGSSLLSQKSCRPWQGRLFFCASVSACVSLYDFCSSLSRYAVPARFKLFPSLLFNVSSRRGAVSSFGSASKKSMASLLAKAKSLRSRTRSATRKSVTPCCRIPQTSPGPRCFRSASARSNPLEVRSIAWIRSRPSGEVVWPSNRMQTLLSCPRPTRPRS